MSKPKRDITPEESAQVESLAAHGHTQEEIAVFLGMSARHFRRTKGENKSLMSSYNRGRFKAKNYVASRLMRFIKDDELTAVNLSAITFYLKTQGGWGSEHKNDNKPVYLTFSDKQTPAEMLNIGFNALAEGHIDFAQLQQIGSLALTKMNIENNGSKNDKAVYQQRSREEALDFAAKMKEARENLRLINESNTKAN
ncbi:MAG: hypothetical protein H6911_05840 [Rickettsiaceae bacterium]|nr:hypothetical protein [Rickettsiaceae bacterium]